MKTRDTWVSSLAACALIAAGVLVAAPPASARVCDGAEVPCKIGDTGPGGGIVFYDAGARQAWGRYLEAAPCKYRDRKRCVRTSWVEKHDPQSHWCETDRVGFKERLPTGTDVGAGRANTELIVRVCGPDSAAGVAAAYRGGGKDDWFLPSKDELNALYVQRKVVGALAVPRGLGRFWSSSQSSDYVDEAWCQSFGNGSQAIDNKFDIWRVRPVRAF